MTTKPTAPRPPTATEQRNQAAKEPSIKDLFPDKWLQPDHIAGRQPTVAIEAVAIEELYSAQTKKPELKLVVKFHRATVRLVCNKTQAFRLAELCKTENYLKWVGHQVVLSVAPRGYPARNGKDTIIIGPVPDAATPPPSPATAADNDASDDASDEEYLDIDIDLENDEDPARYETEPD